MRYFRHTIAEHPCTQHCGYKRSDVDANMSPFHLIAAAAATVPIWLFSLHEGFEWYYLVSILAGELLLLFASGILSSILIPPIAAIGFVIGAIWGLITKRPMALRGKIGRCPNCGSTLFFAGRHFDPLGSKHPHWTDIVIFIAFIALNVTVWVCLVKSGS